jgi:signal recognition particle subunit SRP54
MRADLTIDEFSSNLAQLRMLGGVRRGMETIPGGSELLSQSGMDEVEVERGLERMSAICGAMTAAERDAPDAIDPAAMRSIAGRAGVDVGEVERFLTDFKAARERARAARHDD